MHAVPLTLGYALEGCDRLTTLSGCVLDKKLMITRCQCAIVKGKLRKALDRSRNYISGLPHLFYLLWPLSVHNWLTGAITIQKSGQQVQNNFYKSQTPKVRGILRYEVTALVQNGYNKILIAGASHSPTLYPLPTASEVNFGLRRSQFWKDSSLRPPSLVLRVVSSRPQMAGA